MCYPLCNGYLLRDLNGIIKLPKNSIISYYNKININVFNADIYPNSFKLFNFNENDLRQIRNKRLNNNELIMLRRCLWNNNNIDTIGTHSEALHFHSIVQFSQVWSI